MLHTTRLNNGQLVVAHEGEDWPKTYTNFTQAKRAVAKLQAEGHPVKLYAPAFLRGKYIAVDS